MNTGNCIRPSPRGGQAYHLSNKLYRHYQLKCFTQPNILLSFLFPLPACMSWKAPNVYTGINQWSLLMVPSVISVVLIHALISHSGLEIAIWRPFRGLDIIEVYLYGAFCFIILHLWPNQYGASAIIPYTASVKGLCSGPKAMMLFICRHISVHDGVKRRFRGFWGRQEGSDRDWIEGVGPSSKNMAESPIFQINKLKILLSLDLHRLHR